MAQLTNTYRQYKADTRLFASWFASTAKANGWSQNSERSFDTQATPRQEPAPATTGSNCNEKKANSRRKKKNVSSSAAPEATSTSGANTPAKYAVAISDFVPMAKFLASKGKSTTLPSSIAKILGRVIRLREAFAQVLQQQDSIAAEETTAKNHSYFVDILKQVQHILGGAEAQAANASPTELPNSRECLSTAFAALHVYEPSQAFLDAPSAELVPVPEYDIAEDEAGLQEDAQVAFAALLQDILILRETVKKLWGARYATGNIHLCAVAIATNTAIDLARKMEEEAAPTLDRFGGAAKLLADHYHAAAVAEGLDPSQRAAEGDDINVDTYEIAKRTMYQAYHLLDQFRKGFPDASGSDAGAIRNQQMPPIYDGKPYGWYDPKKAGEYQSAREKHDRDRAGFLEMVSEIAILSQKLNWNNVQDEFTRGVRLLITNPSLPIPFWVIFAAQVFIDNLETLGIRLLHAAVDPTNIGRWIAKRMEVALAGLQGKPRPSGWPAKMDGTLKRLQQDAHFFDTQVISKWKRRSLPSIERPESVLMRHNAVFAGVWAQHLLTLYHATAIAYANAWGAVFAMSQLNAAVMHLAWIKTGQVPVVMWTDMLIMQNLQGPDRFWVGSEPRDIRDYWKQWCLCQGVSLAEFTSSRGVLPVGGATNGNNNPRRGLGQLAPVSLLFRGRLGTDAAGHARVNVTLEDVRNIVGKGEWVVTRASEGNVFEMVQEYETSSTRPFRQASDSDETRHRRTTLPSRGDHLALSPADLVNTLANVVHAEMAELHFDYMLLHTKCWMILTDFKRIMDPYFRRACEGRPDYITSEDQLPLLVGLIFRAAAGLAPGLGPRDSLELLDAAREGFRWLLNKGMNRIVVDELQKLGIPIDLEFEHGPVLPT